MRDWLKVSIGGAVMWIASTAFTSFTNTWGDTGCSDAAGHQHLGTQLLSATVGIHKPNLTKKPYKTCSFECFLQKGLGSRGEGRKPWFCNWVDTISHCHDSSPIPVCARGRKDKRLREGRGGADWENTQRQTCAQPDGVNPIRVYASSPSAPP